MNYGSLRTKASSDTVDKALVGYTNREIDEQAIQASRVRFKLGPEHHY